MGAFLVDGGLQVADISREYRDLLGLAFEFQLQLLHLFRGNVKTSEFQLRLKDRIVLFSYHRLELADAILEALDFLLEAR